LTSPHRPNNRGPNLKVLADIANECFMPLGYGGGIRSLDQAKAVFNIGFEKVAINTRRGRIRR
jgi:cyclase